jgi:hypothetical protein
LKSIPDWAAWFFLNLAQEVFHNPNSAVVLAVNNSAVESCFTLISLTGFGLLTGCPPAIFGEQAVDKNSLSDRGSQLRYSQFIERTEMDGGDRKKVVGRLKDDPRQLGKG